jgi:hypothetical protein
MRNIKIFFSLPLILLFSGCDVTSVGQMQYSGVEYRYEKHQLKESHTASYTYQENGSTFTLSGENIFTFNGSHPDRRGSDYTQYAGTYSGGAANVSFIMGIHITYSTSDTTGSEFDGQLK